MVEWIIPPVGLIEPVPAPEFYIDGIGAVEMIGACVRIYYFVDQMPLEVGGVPAQKIVALKIVRPIESIPAAIIRLATCLATAERSPGVHSGPPFKPRLVQ